eukprot:TRINITY_DN1914_c0_g1_i1.p1 TRINITY_DN1914_c0_g1~~TRINITY_DN1914_c0_g1_i1.p1  ORF type:complete len:602 (-),score=153.40 TRINITY_DN1914_c0_g1_i1:107-1912(-)
MPSAAEEPLRRSQLFAGDDSDGGIHHSRPKPNPNSLVSAPPSSSAGESFAAAGWRLGRGIAACGGAAALLLLVVCVCLPLAIVIAWRFLPARLTVNKAVNFDYRLSPPAAIVSFLPLKTDSVLVTRVKNLLERNGQDPPNLLSRRQQRSLRLMPRGSAYEISVEMTLPLTDNNKRVGMFQVTTSALSPNGDVVAYSSTPCHPLYHGRKVSMRQGWSLWQLFKLPLLPFRAFASLCRLLWWRSHGDDDDDGGHAHRQLLSIHLRLLRSHDGFPPLAGVLLALEPKAGLNPADGLPDILSAQLLLRSGGGSSGMMGRIMWLLRLAGVTWVMCLCLCLLTLPLLLLCCFRVFFPSPLPSSSFHASISCSPRTNSYGDMSKEQEISRSLLAEKVAEEREGGNLTIGSMPVPGAGRFRMEERGEGGGGWVGSRPSFTEMVKGEAAYGSSSSTSSRVAEEEVREEILRLDDMEDSEVERILAAMDAVESFSEEVSQTKAPTAPLLDLDSEGSRVTATPALPRDAVEQVASEELASMDDAAERNEVTGFRRRRGGEDDPATGVQENEQTLESEDTEVEKISEGKVLGFLSFGSDVQGKAFEGQKSKRT